ncbi:MAG TPA: cation-transporting P-type ATPase, partial [Gammaproteobacteria bacterium]|nr:cation-transporting P-type ATPase [Gammaproteobacteria bacterium]
MAFEKLSEFLRRGAGTNGDRGGARVSARLVEISRMAADDTFDEFHTSIQGLIESAAEERLAEYGPNTVAREEKKSFLTQLFTRLFFNPLNVLLIVLTIVSVVTGDMDGATIIGLMVVLSVALSWIQEARSNNAAEKLRAMVKTTATALRREEIEEEDEEETETEGEDQEEKREKKKSVSYKAVRKQVPLDELVPGDLVQLSAGDMIPADVRLLSAKDLFINQAALTGESLPVEKTATAVENAAGSPLDLPNLCFMGTNVVSGTAIAIVVMTGANTYFGALASTLGVQKVQTSFDKGVNRFTWLMIKFMAFMVPTVFLING